MDIFKSMYDSKPSSNVLTGKIHIIGSSCVAVAFILAKIVLEITPNCNKAYKCVNITKFLVALWALSLFIFGNFTYATETAALLYSTIEQKRILLFLSKICNEVNGYFQLGRLRN